MQEFHFKCQYFWTRVLSFIPIIFLLAFGEYALFEKLFDNSENLTLVFFAISASLTIFFGIIFFKHTGKLFAFSVKAILLSDSVRFAYRKKLVEIRFTDVCDLQYNKINAYRVMVGQFIISTKSKKFRLYSADIVGEFENSDIYKLYDLLKPNIIKCN